MPNLNKKILHLDVPKRMVNLPISDEGFPIPWFVPWYKGKPEFRAMDSEKFVIAVRHGKCWLCGQTMGVHKTFPIGPMCMVNKVISEPPSHKECATYGVRACPFLTQPRMRRNEKDKPEGHIAGIGIMRNPGVTVLWTTRTFTPFKPGNGGVLFRLGEPEDIEFWYEGRRASIDEVLESINTGMPILVEEAEKEGQEAVDELWEKHRTALKRVLA